MTNLSHRIVFGIAVVAVSCASASAQRVVLVDEHISRGGADFHITATVDLAAMKYEDDTELTYRNFKIGSDRREIQVRATEDWYIVDGSRRIENKADDILGGIIATEDVATLVTQVAVSREGRDVRLRVAFHFMGNKVFDVSNGFPATYTERDLDGNLVNGDANVIRHGDRIRIVTRHGYTITSDNGQGNLHAIISGVSLHPINSNEVFYIYKIGWEEDRDIRAGNMVYLMPAASHRDRRNQDLFVKSAGAVGDVDITANGYLGPEYANSSELFYVRRPDGQLRDGFRVVFETMAADRGLDNHYLSCEGSIGDVVTTRDAVLIGEPNELNSDEIFTVYLHHLHD